MTKKLPTDVCHRIVALFEMTQHASREDADEFTRNEGINATAALLRLLTERSLTLGDMPEIQRQHAENEAEKAAAKAAGMATASKSNEDQPNALAFELVHRVLQEYSDAKPHEYRRRHGYLDCMVR